MLTNIVLNIILISPLAHAGIALSTSLAAVVNAGLLFYFLRKRLYYIPQPGWMVFTTRLFLANTILAAWLFVTSAPTEVWVSESPLWRFEHLAGILGGAMLVYIAALLITGLRPRHILIPERPDAF